MATIWKKQLENLQKLISQVYDICQLDVDAQKKDSQLMVTWPTLASMTQNTVPWTPQQTRPNTLYIHIPFCTGICTYCNYVTKAISPDSGEIQSYLDLLEQEAKLLCQSLRTDRIIVDSIYIGGGTPSLLRVRDLDRLLAIIDKFFTSPPASEFTLEGCPETLDSDKLGLLQHSRVNRISIGVETFNDDILSAVNRRHDARQAKKCIEQILKHGFFDFDIDLINNLPGSTAVTVAADCKTAMDLLVPSITLYHYHVKPKSIDSKKTTKQQYLMIKQQEILLHQIYQNLLSHKYDEYMIDWYSRGGLRFRHQIYKWQHDANQLTLGTGCYGYYEGTQFSIHRSMASYRRAIEDQILPISSAKSLSDSQIQKRRYLFDLRRSRSIGAWGLVSHASAIKQLEDLGLLTVTDQESYIISEIGTLFFDDMQRLLAE